MRKIWNEKRLCGKEVVFIIFSLLMCFILSLTMRNKLLAADMEYAEEVCVDGTTYNGIIMPDCNSNYYRFTLESSGSITLTATAEIQYLDYYIYDDSGNEVWTLGYVSANDITGKSNTKVTVDLIKGTYYFAIRQLIGEGSYSFKLLFSSAEESFLETIYETDNSISTANNISLNTEYKGQIAENDKEDYYRFTLDSSGRITLTAIAKIKQLNYYIYNEIGDEIWQDEYVQINNTTGQSNKEAMVDLIKGTYYFVVRKLDGTGNYSFGLGYSNAEESFTETISDTDNSMSTANSIFLDTEYKGQIAKNDSGDYYKFILDSSGRIMLTAIAKIEQLNYYIYDDFGNEVWKREYIQVNDTTGQSNTEVAIDLIKGTYYFLVNKYWGTGNYSFKLEYSNAEESFSETASKMNNSMNTANSISLATEYKGQIAENDADDYYRFTLDSPGQITLNAIAKVDQLNYYIYDSMGNEVWGKRYVEANNTTGQSDMMESINLAKGTYYFLVNKYWGAGNYSFMITKYIATPTVTSIQNTSSGIKMKWSLVSDAAGYYIYRRTDSGEWEKVKTTSSTSWTDKKATINGTEYAYKVYAYRADAISDVGEYDYEQIYYLTTPKFSSIENTAPGKVTVKWTKNTKATGYQIKYKSKSTSKTITVYSYKTVKKVIMKLKKGEKCNFYIRAYYQPDNANVKYYSAWSVVESILIKK